MKNIEIKLGLKKWFAVGFVAIFAATPLVAQALDNTIIMPLVPIVSADTEDYIDSRPSVWLDEDTVVTNYVTGNDEQYAVVSNDNGATWGTPSFVATSIEANISKISANRVVSIYQSEMNQTAPLYARFGTVSGSTITWESPVVVSANDTRAASLQLGLPGLAVAEENKIYVYAIGTDLDWTPTTTVFFQFVSNDNGATWSRQETTYVRADNLSYNYFEILNLAGPAHAISATGWRLEQTAPAYYETIPYQDIRVFDGSSWSSLYNHQGREANAGVINDGKGIATGFYTRDGFAHTAVWQEVSSPGIETDDVSTYTIEDPVLETDGKNRIAFSYAEQQPNGEIVFHLRISTDFGVTWSDNQVFSVAAGNWVCPGFIALSADTEIIYGFGVFGEEGCSLNVVISNDSGQTWTEPVEVIEGDVSDFWYAEPHWVAGSDATVILTHVVNLENYYYVPTALRFATATTGPEKLGFKAQFNFGKLKLSTAKKAALKSWAEQIPDGTTVRVTAPDFEKPDVKAKKLRSTKRAQAVATILRNSGLSVKVVPGKLVEWVDPIKGRLVKVRITTADK